MNSPENIHITQEGPKRAFLGRVQKTIQEVQHQHFGKCYRVWFSGCPEPILFVPWGNHSVMEVGIMPLSYPGSTDRDKKLIRWAIDRYREREGMTLFDDPEAEVETEEDHPFSGDAIQP